MQKLRLLFSYTKGQRLLYIVAFICTVLSQVMLAVQPQLLKISIDTVLASKPLSGEWFSRIVGLMAQHLHGLKGLLIIAAFMLLAAVLRALLTYARKNLATRATETSIKALRERLYNHLQLLPYSYHSKVNTGDLIQRCTSDVEAIWMALQTQLLDGISIFFLIGYSVYLMAKASVPLMLVSLIIMPIIIVIGSVFFRRMAKEFKKESELEAQMTTTIQENLTGIRVVKAFTKHQDEIEKFSKCSERYLQQNIRVNRFFAFLWAMMDSLVIVQLFAVLLYGSVLTYRGAISVGDLVAFISYVTMLMHPVKMLGRLIGSIGKSFVSVARVQTILDEPAEELFPTKEEPVINGDIVFKNVSFAYPEGKKVLDNISFSIKDGEHLAIVGATGSGKSSLVHLLVRLYDYDSGSIRINGTELKTIDKGYIRSQIALILQEPFLYAKTIMQNLTLAVPDASHEEALHHSRIAALDAEILNFEDGYETMVGEKGVSLSGGQKQRLAIARTLIKNSPVIIFDDSLSAVDTQTDIQIREALKKEHGNKTMIIISHRISTVCDAKHIIVLEKGRISQHGTHEDLIQQDGLYKRLYEIQHSIEDVDTYGVEGAINF